METQQKMDELEAAEALHILTECSSLGDLGIKRNDYRRNISKSSNITSIQHL